MEFIIRREIKREEYFIRQGRDGSQSEKDCRLTVLASSVPSFLVGSNPSSLRALSGFSGLMAGGPGPGKWRWGHP